MTSAVTDNARDVEPMAWCPGCGDRIPTEVVRERGVCSNCYGTTDDPWAAGRAETTTATTEDTARAIHRALAPRWMSVAQALGPDQDAYEAMLADIAKALADAGLLATARTRPTRYEVARAIRLSRTNGLCKPGVRCDLCDCAQDYEDDLALRDADAVLALYTYQPTRDDLARAIASGYEPDHPTPNRHDYRAADAVLALFNEKGD